MLKTYLRKKYLTTKANVIAIKTSNLKIANNIVITTKTK